jgi:hypothetical protein
VPQHLSNWQYDANKLKPHLEKEHSADNCDPEDYLLSQSLKFACSEESCIDNVTESCKALLASQPVCNRLAQDVHWRVTAETVAFYAAINNVQTMFGGKRTQQVREKIL